MSSFLVKSQSKTGLIHVQISNQQFNEAWPFGCSATVRNYIKKNAGLSLFYPFESHSNLFDYSLTLLRPGCFLLPAKGGLQRHKGY